MKNPEDQAVDTVANDKQSTILIVDDTPANIGVLVEYLSGAGFRTLIAEDGIEALANVDRFTPDLILLDVMMPGLDGLQTCQRLKASERTRHIPVLFMTALSSTEDKLRGFEAGAVDYVTKPLQNEEVLARIRTHLTVEEQRAQIERQRLLLEQRNEMKDRFMRIASHDLRNLLAVMSLRCSMLLDEEGAEDGPLVQQTAASLKTSIGRMNDIIHGFLSRSGGADFELQAGRVDLAGLMTEVVEQYRSLADKKDILLSLAPPESPSLVLGDGARIHQVLTNYVSNALKYSPPGTRVALRAHTSPDTRFIRIEVADQGPGVSPDEREQLFLEFAQISNRPTGDEESTGIGLSIVKRLVEAQGGQVGAAFPESGGAVFWAELPRAKPD